MSERKALIKALLRASESQSAAEAVADALDAYLETLGVEVEHESDDDGGEG